EHHSVSGSGTATGIAPGFTFSIINAPHFSDNGEYLVTSATYDFAENSYASGDTGDSRHNIHFTVLPSSVTYRTPPETAWPKTHGPQTAKVVGPKGESIWTDRYGRVKVKFHWDRLAKGDDTSSCWVRVSSAWAGQGFGGVQIPRVNDEVVVDFINGDPDRPLIIGRVYNEASMPPWALPAAATQMGFLSRSKDGTADTANALRFEDKSGEEHLWIQAQKNMDTHVKNDASHSVANNHSHYAGGNELYRVETNRVHGVKGGEERLTGKGKLDAVVDTYVVGSGTKLRLECGESAIELNANGQINIVGKGFNIFVQGDGHITTSGGKLNLNTDGAKPGTSAPGSSHKQNISQAVENLFPPKQKGQAAPAAPKAAAAPAKGAAAPLANNQARKVRPLPPEKQAFFDKVYAAAQEDEKKTGVPAKITTAQAILESNWGKKMPTDIKTDKVSNNIFGVKAHGSPNYVEDWTHENINGKRVAVLDKFASYDSIDESIEQHSQFLIKNQRYSSLFNSSDPVEWAKGLQAKGYATDPNYANSLISVMKGRGLL
ncbi:type VI secretion system tip protein TssI/VgrG, partial [Pantoea agglomerans]